ARLLRKAQRDADVEHHVSGVLQRGVFAASLGRAAFDMFDGGTLTEQLDAVDRVDNANAQVDRLSTTAHRAVERAADAAGSALEQAREMQTVVADTPARR